LSDGYDLRTTWRVQGAGAGEVWDVLEDAGRWPEWWRGLRSVTEIERGGSDGIGQVARLEWRGVLPYSLLVDMRATQKARPALLEGEATGDLAGVGRFEITEAQDPGGVTSTVVYAWRVQTTKPWMQRSAPLLRPVFVWGHDHIMRAGGTGLARRLGARLLHERP
jgi:hypothetical protein